MGKCSLAGKRVVTGIGVGPKKSDRFKGGYIYIYPCKVPLKLHTICTAFIWMYVFIYTYCTYLYYAHSFEHKSTKCKHTYMPRTARFIFSQSILFHISMCFFPGCHVVHVWTNNFLKQSLGGGSGFIFLMFIPILENDPIWIIIFFDWIETTN